MPTQSVGHSLQSMCARVCHERMRRSGCRRSDRWCGVASEMEGPAHGGLVGLRGRSAGGGRKPPRGASVKSRGAERCGEGAPRARQVWAKKANASDPLMTCRKLSDDGKTGLASLARDQSGGCLLTGQVLSGMKVARAWSGLRCGTWEPVVPRPRTASGAARACGCAWKGDLQAAETARGGVPMRGTGADRLVVAARPGNAGGAKGAGHPGLFGGQPRRRCRGKSR